MAKSSTERGLAREARLKQAGYKLLRNFWIKPEYEAAIRAYAAVLRSKEKGDDFANTPYIHLTKQAH